MAQHLPQGIAGGSTLNIAGGSITDLAGDYHNDRGDALNYQGTSTNHSQPG